MSDTTHELLAEMEIRDAILEIHEVCAEYGFDDERTAYHVRRYLDSIRKLAKRKH